MGMMDKAKDKAKDAMGEHGDKADQGIDKAADMAKEKTGGQHDDKIDQGVEKGKQAAEDFGPCFIIHWYFLWSRSLPVY
jgi:hypothetical protein